MSTNDLQRRKIAEISVANDAIIESFARALDLREQVEEGHTLRVAELTVRLAGALGLGEKELSHIKYGAILHDIGMMAVPESILHKKGPLDEAEWLVMRKHPLYGHDLLAPVPFLHAALDIPMYHHERWDGSGYPQHLRGEAIPLAARVFSVVDVWDALRSDRPYRQAWLMDPALAYIASLAGSHCDPQVVKVFLEGEIWRVSV